MKMITIRLPDVEAAMSLEIQRNNKTCKMLIAAIKRSATEIYSRLP